MKRTALVLLVACGGSPRPAPAPPPDEVSCTALEFQMIAQGASQSSGASNAPAYDAAYQLAEADHRRGIELAAAHDQASAALAFLDCARRFRSVPASDPLRDTAIYDATVCYANASAAFANAAQFTSRGKALLEQAATEDPDLTAPIRKLLAEPPVDCLVRS